MDYSHSEFLDMLAMINVAILFLACREETKEGLHPYVDITEAGQQRVGRV